MAWQPDYCTVGELKAFLRVDDGDDDVELGGAVTAASRAIDTACGRQFGSVPAAQQRWFPAEWDRYRGAWVVTIDDLMVDPAAVEVGGANTSAFVLHDRNAPAKGRPWTRLILGSGAGDPGDDDVAVTAAWGWTAVPATVKEAALLQASRFSARRDSPYGIAGAPDQGGELRLLARVDADVETMLRSYRRWWGAA